MMAIVYAPFLVLKLAPCSVKFGSLFDFERIGGWHFAPSMSAALILQMYQHLPRCILGPLADDHPMPD